MSEPVNKLETPSHTSSSSALSSISFETVQSKFIAVVLRAVGVCAIGHELVQHGHKVLFVPAFKLVQRLLAAKKDLALEKELRKLDRFDAVILEMSGGQLPHRGRKKGQRQLEINAVFLLDAGDAGRHASARPRLAPVAATESPLQGGS